MSLWCTLQPFRVHISSTHTYMNERRGGDVSLHTESLSSCQECFNTYNVHTVCSNVSCFYLLYFLLLRYKFNLQSFHLKRDALIVTGHRHCCYGCHHKLNTGAVWNRALVLIVFWLSYIYGFLFHTDTLDSYWLSFARQLVIPFNTCAFRYASISRLLPRFVVQTFAGKHF